MQGKPRATVEDKIKIKEKKVKKRDNYEKKNVGNFDLIFPSETDTVEEY